MPADRLRPIAVVFGTRPEAIKLAPVILELRERAVPHVVVTTGQHRELVDSILDHFHITVDEDLDLMRPEQSLDYVMSTALTGIGEALDRYRPGAVLVQGDTTSAMAASLAAFHRRLPLGHVEAGLRSRNMELPFPEELNRRVTSLVARWHFAPTEGAAENLRAENVSGAIHVTGNTVVDALHHIIANHPGLPADLDAFASRKPLVLATAHRRESWDGGIAEIARALAGVLDELPDLRVIFVTHPNPMARGPVVEALGNHERALVMDAVDYPTFVELLGRSTIAVSDSGGVQEEGPTLGIPVLVTRAVTERPEGVAAGAVRIIGTAAASVRETVLEVLADGALRQRMSEAGPGVYGDGKAAAHIVDILQHEMR
jgi:UDP-N-acetylglucosamine 2-epimerase (non-hydrolysing)